MLVLVKGNSSSIYHQRAGLRHHNANQTTKQKKEAKKRNVIFFQLALYCFCSGKHKMTRNNKIQNLEKPSVAIEETTLQFEQKANLLKEIVVSRHTNFLDVDKQHNFESTF